MKLWCRHIFAFVPLSTTYVQNRKIIVVGKPDIQIAYLRGFNELRLASNLSEMKNVENQILYRCKKR